MLTDSDAMVLALGIFLFISSTLQTLCIFALISSIKILNGRIYMTETMREYEEQKP